MVSKVVNLILRGAAALIALLLTALIGNVIASTTNAQGSATAAVNFAMFCTAWAWLALIYGVATDFRPSLARPVIKIPVEAVAVLLSLLAAIVLAAKLKATNCGAINVKDMADSWIAFGSSNDEKRCREIQASTLFMWMLWAIFCPLLFFTIREGRNAYGTFQGSSKSSSLPSMSHIGA